MIISRICLRVKIQNLHNPVFLAPRLVIADVQINQSIDVLSVPVPFRKF